MYGSSELKSRDTVLFRLSTSAFGPVLCLIAFQVLVLTLVPTLVSTSPPLDVVEGWTWAPHWPLGTYKHPPMPAWLLQITQHVIPGFIFAPFLLSQLAIAVTYLCIFFCGRLLMDGSRAGAGTLLLTGSVYFTYLSPEFNHNVLQMPFWAATILTAACILKSPQRTSLWIILGILVGSGMYVKYSFAVLPVVIAASALLFPQVRAQYLTFRPWLAAVLAVGIFMPHLLWLIDSHFEPLLYAEARSKSHGSVFQPIMSLITQIADHVPMLVLLSFVGIRLIRSAKPQETGAQTRLFLRIVTFAPFLLVVAMAIMSGKSLRDMWGMPLFTTVGLWAVAELGRAWNPEMLKRLLLSAIGLVAVASLGLVGEALWARDHKPGRKFWPMQEFASKAEAFWASQTKGPLTIVGGDYWLGGLVSINTTERPAVIPDDDLHHAPWVTQQDIDQRGMLYLTLSAAQSPPAYCKTYGRVGEIILSHPHLPRVYAYVCYPQAGTP